MECSAKPQICIENEIRTDSLWCGILHGIKRGRAQKAFWNDMRDGAEYSRNEWREILSSMARFECRVDIKSKPGVDYEYVSPERGQRDQAGTTPNMNKAKHDDIQSSGMTPSPSHRSSGRQRRTTGLGLTKSSSGVRKASRLRYEVTQEN